jgi:geranylgeranyl diphosphate synthase type 3
VFPLPNPTTNDHPPTRHKVDENLLEPWTYILNVPGKNIRGKMIQAWNTWLKVDAPLVGAISEVVKMLHTSSLLIDDIEDDSTLRRGVPVAHTIYGLPSTLNTANYVYVLALEKCIHLNSPAATQVFTQELLNLHRGQGQDILWRDTCVCPSEEQYRSMVLDKTGGLFRLAVGLMQCFSQDKTDYCPLLNSMAYYFQVRDDYMNIASTEYFANKSFCEDLTEGKFSFPIIHCIRTKPNDNRLVRILKQKTRDVTVKKHAVEWMMKCGSLDYTINKLNELYAECIDLIKGLGGHLDLQALLKKLHSQIEEATTVNSPKMGHGDGKKRANSPEPMLLNMVNSEGIGVTNELENVNGKGGGAVKGGGGGGQEDEEREGEGKNVDALPIWSSDGGSGNVDLRSGSGFDTL